MSSWSINRAPAASTVQAAILTAQIFPNLLTPAIAAVMSIEAASVLEQKVFLLRASGYATTAAATTTVLASLYAAVALPAAGGYFTVGNYTLLAASTARVQNTTSAPWWIEAELICDSVSGKLHGGVNACVNNGFDNKLPISNVMAGLKPNGQGATATDPFLFIVAAITFGVNASAANIAGCGDFVLDA